MSYSCHLWVITSFVLDPNMDSVWMLILVYGLVDSFIASCCIGKCTRELTGTCDRRVRPQCLGCTSAQSAEVHR